MEHKDLSARARAVVYGSAAGLVDALSLCGESLALAREAWIKAFDDAAAKDVEGATEAEPRTTFDVMATCGNFGADAIGGFTLHGEGEGS